MIEVVYKIAGILLILSIFPISGYLVSYSQKIKCPFCKSRLGTETFSREQINGSIPSLILNVHCSKCCKDSKHHMYMDGEYGIGYEYLPDAK